MKKWFILALGITLLSGCGQKMDTTTKNAAILSAKSWLQLVDNNQFGQSWNEAASHFKASVPQSQWNDMIRAVRVPLGNTQSREVKSAKYMTSLPGAPDGEYVVIQFKTNFANKKSSIETITPMKDTDGQWRVSGYYIK